MPNITIQPINGLMSKMDGFQRQKCKWSINIWEHIQDHCLSEKCKSECVEVLSHLRQNSCHSENSQQQYWQGCGEREGLGPRWWKPDEDSSKN